MTILTLGEIKNGWTELTLKRHLKDMDRHAGEMIYSQRKKPRPRIQNNNYSPHRWRR